MNGKKRSVIIIGVIAHVRAHPLDPTGGLPSVQGCLARRGQGNDRSASSSDGHVMSDAKIHKTTQQCRCITLEAHLDAVGVESEQG